mgnify:CR=1 FL=1
MHHDSPPRPQRSGFAQPNVHPISNRDHVDHVEPVEDLPQDPFSLYGTLPRSWKEKNLVTSSVIEDEEVVSR